MFPVTKTIPSEIEINKILGDNWKEALSDIVKNCKDPRWNIISQTLSMIRKHIEDNKQDNTSNGLI